MSDLDKLAHLRRARDYMDREFARIVDVAEVARVAFMSAAHFSRSFRDAYGETPHAYLMTRRVERAAMLLRAGELSVTEVCIAVGCTSLGSFSSRFRELTGQSPTQYRAANHASIGRLPGCVQRHVGRSRREMSRFREARVAGSR